MASEARNVRNFFLEGKIDGVSSEIATGPKSKTGGFELTVKMRDNGEIINAMTLYGIADEHGNLMLVANGRDGQRVEILTVR